MSDDSEVATIAGIIEDSVSRCILRSAYGQHLSASELADGCDASEPTIYRRLETLSEHDLVVERGRPDEDGHHYTEYRTNLERVTVEVGPDGFELRISRRETPADRFTRLIEEM